MSEQSLKIIDAIKERLRRTARRRYLSHLVFGSILLMGVFSGLWLIFTAIEAGFWLTSPLRVVSFSLILLLSIIVFSWFILLPLLRMLGMIPGANEYSLAKDVGTAYPQISDRLLNLLHLAEGKRSLASPDLVNHAVLSLSRQIEPVEFEKMETFDRAIRASRYAVLPLAGILVFFLAAPSSFLGASQRLLDPGAEFMRPAPFQFQVSPGSIELLRGDSLHIEVDLTGADLPSAVTLRYRNQQEDKITEEVLVADSTGTFNRTFINVRNSFSYSMTAVNVQSSWYDVDIVERPIIRSLQVSLDFPRYSRIPAQRLEPNVGDIHALPGTQIRLEAMVGGPDIREAFVVYDNGSMDTLVVGFNQIEGSFTLAREGTYHIQLLDANGTTNSDPIKYSMKLMRDSYPTAVLLSPNALSELNETLQTNLQARITDDFGFNRARLFYRLSETRFGETMPQFESIALPITNVSELDQELLFNWDLRSMTPLDPVPGDAIEYYIEVWDNDTYSGYKSSKSSTHLLRLPSLAEQYQDLEQQEDTIQDEMEELLDETRRIDEQFNELQNELRNKLESDWEDDRQLEQLKEKQADLESRVESMNDSFEEMMQQMENNNLSSDETQQLYEEMQEVLEEINSPELMDALNQLQEAMQDLNLQQMQESLNNFQFNEEQYQQRLERTLELFKQIRVQQDLDEVAKRAEELAKQQEQLQEETDKLKNEEESGESDQPQDPNGDNNEQDPSGNEEGGEQQEGEQQEGEQQEGEQQEGEQQEGQQQEGQQQGEQQEGEQQEGEQQEGQQQQGEQQESSESNENSPQEKLAQQQELSKEEMEQLEQKMEEILQKMEELQNSPSEQMEQLNEQVQEQQIPQQMQDNADQLRQNQLDQAQQQQQQMQQQLQQMQQQLQQMQQGMQGAQMQINLAGLRRALSDILTLSQLQEGLRENVRDLATDSPTMRQLAQEQVELSTSLSVVSDSLQSLARQIPQMTREVQQHAGDAMREMGSAVESMTDRVANRASGHQKESMMHLNELALLLSDLLNEMMNQQGSGGGGMSMQQMIQQLQNAAGEQQKLNQQIQQMLNESQGNRLSPDMQQRLRQMAAQQEQIRSEIKKLGRNRELRRDVMGDLNRIADQMEETIRELQRSRPGRRTVERQQEILTRLLEATKSMQERGREKRREGEVGEEFYRESPEAISPSEEADQLRRALIEALESGYSPDYEELIKKYFELLQQQSTDSP